MMSRKTFARALAAASLLCASAASHATFVVYNTEASFLAAVSAPGTDTFSGFLVTGTTPSPIVRTAGAYGYTASVDSSTFFGAGTVADPWLSTNEALANITFNTFSPAVSAIGGFFFGSDINGQFLPGISITLVATDADGSLTETISNSTENSFRGFVSTGPLTSLTVTAVQPSSPAWPTVEDLTLAEARAAAVPEPESAALLLAALGLMGTMAGRRRN